MQVRPVEFLEFAVSKVLARLQASSGAKRELRGQSKSTLISGDPQEAHYSALAIDWRWQSFKFHTKLTHATALVERQNLFLAFGHMIIVVHAPAVTYLRLKC